MEEPREGIGHRLREVVRLGASELEPARGRSRPYFGLTRANEQTEGVPACQAHHTLSK
jgi:hypothetical protein